MAIEKDRNLKARQGPAVAADGELEKYGVWVKADPQDISEDLDLPESLDIDVDAPSIGPESGAEESFLTEEEETLLGSLESFDQGRNVQEEDIPELLDLDEVSPPPAKAPARAAPASESSESMDFTDFSVEEFTGSPSSPPVEAFPASEKSSSNAIEEVSFDDFLDESPKESEAKELEAGLDESPIDMDLEFDDSLPEDHQGTGSMPSLDDFDIDSIGTEDKDLDLSDVKTSGGAASKDLEEIGIDEMISLNVDEEIPEFGSSASVEVETSVAGANSDFGASSADDFASEGGEGLPEDIESMDLGLGLAIPKKSDFDDIAAVEASLGDDLGIQEARTARAATSLGAAPGETGEGKEILLKIAQELSSIKYELSSLRDRMDRLQPGTAAVPASGQAEDDDKAGGFFDDEEDETIALTGDELDNILNTADFTEESGVETVDGSSEAPDGALVDLPDILGEDGEALSAALNAPAFAEGGADDSNEINLLHEVEVTPITKAPDDTSYLDLETEPDFGDITLTEPPLVEPVLEDLSIEEGHGAGIPAVDGGVDDFAPIEEILIDESEVVQAGPEFDSALEEISLSDDTPIEKDDLGGAVAARGGEALPDHLKKDIRAVLSYMDKLLESLPEDKIEEFAKSDHFQVYKKLFEELGLL